MEAGSKQGPKISPHKSAALVSALAAVAILGLWVFSGASLVTQYQVAQTEVIADEFGDEVEITTMVDQFQFGLLPDKGYDGALPLSGALLAIAGVLFFLGRRKEEPLS